MSIPSEQLSRYQLIHPEKTTFRLRPKNLPTKRVTPSFHSPHHQLYKKSWERTNAKIAKIVDDLQSGLLDDLTTFIKTTRFEERKRLRQPIPTAVILGASKILNASLAIRVDDLRSSTGALEYIPLQLSSRTCLTLSASIKSIVGLLENYLLTLDNQAHSDHDAIKTNQPNDPLARDDIHNIKALYAEFLSRHSSSSSSRASSALKLVFLIDDFEGFDSSVLEDLIAIMSDLSMAKVPIILVLSINTSADAIHSLLPRTAVLKLRMTPFAVDMSGGAITSLIQKISLDAENSFDLSSGVIRALMGSHERLNKSMDVMISKLKYVHLAYFHTNPLAGLFDACAGEEEGAFKTTVVEEAVGGQMGYLAHHLRLTSSWKKHAALRRKQHVGPGPYAEPDDREMLRVVVGSYRARRTSRRLTGVALDLLHRLGGFWPEKERTHEWIMFHVFRAELEEYALELCNLIKHSNDLTVLAILRAIADLALPGSLGWVEPSLRRLSELMADDERKRAGRAHLVNTHEPSVPGTHVGPQDAAFSALVGEIAGALGRFLRASAGPASLQTLHEAWTFDDSLLLNQAFHPPYTALLQAALARAPGPLAPLASMFQLWAESRARLVNLADWLGAFALRAPIAPALARQVAFLAALADLAFLGLVAPSARKKEHVAKNFLLA